MARYRLSDPAKADLAAILRRSGTQRGAQARARYQALLITALRRIAADPTGLNCEDRSEIVADLRSFHIRHCRAQSPTAPVADPPHIVFYRVIHPEIVEIIRVLHERMEPGGHIDPR